MKMFHPLLRWNPDEIGNGLTLGDAASGGSRVGKKTSLLICIGVTESKCGGVNQPHSN